MYLRQMKQFIRAARPDFDERRFGSLPELLRACQKDGLLRLERDRQGGLRAYAGAAKPSNVPHGWGSLEVSAPGPDGDSAETPTILHDASPEESSPVSESLAAPEAAPELEPDDQLAMFGPVSPADPEPTPRPRRAASGAAGTKAKRARPTRTKNEERRTKGVNKERATRNVNDERPRARATRARKSTADGS